MTSLLKFDPLTKIPVRREEITAAHAAAESILSIDGKRLQFCAVSRQRMLDTIAGMHDEETVEWRLGCNTNVTLNKQQLQDLYDQGLQNAAQRVRDTFQYASELKARFDAGERITQRDIHIDQWCAK